MLTLAIEQSPRLTSSGELSQLEQPTGCKLSKGEEHHWWMAPGPTKFLSRGQDFALLPDELLGVPVLAGFEQHHAMTPGRGRGSVTEVVRLHGLVREQRTRM